MKSATSLPKETMSTPEDSNEPAKRAEKKPNEEVARREARLKQALRDNLMRRKTKARAVKAAPTSIDDDSSR